MTAVVRFASLPIGIGVEEGQGTGRDFDFGLEMSRLTHGFLAL